MTRWKMTTSVAALLAATVWLLTTPMAIGAQEPPPQTSRMPVGYDPKPLEGKIAVRYPRIDGPGFRVTITNRTASVIDRLGYVGIVERGGKPAVPVPVRILTSPTWPVTLQPGASATIESAWMNARAIDDLLAESGARRQVFLSPGYLRYADGKEWRLHVDPTATSHVGALGWDLPGQPARH
jgi:hypothetical protein